MNPESFLSNFRGSHHLILGYTILHLASELASGLCAACAFGCEDILTVVDSLEACILLAA